MLLRSNRLLLIVTILLGCIAAGADKPTDSAAPPASASPRIDKEGWEILFDGKDLGPWSVPADGGGWEATGDGQLHVIGKGANLFSRRRYCDYVLECDVKLAPGTKGHSGIFLRAHNSRDITSTGIAVQIIDDTAFGAKWDSINANGALVGLVHPTASASNPIGQWNHFHITVNDALVQVEINGKEIVKADLNEWTKPHRNPDNRTNKYEYPINSLPREGFIGLQNYGGAQVWFRNVRIKPLGDRQPKYTGKENLEDVLLPVKKS